MADPRDRPRTNAANPQHVKQAEKIERHDDLQLREYIKVLLGSVAGRFVLWHLMQQTGVSLAQAANPQPEVGAADIWDNSARIHFNAGRLYVGLYIQGLITRADPKASLVMLKEALDAAEYRTRQIVSERMEHSEV